MITKDTEKKLFLLDAYALIYRAFFAFSKSPRINSKGFNTSAIFGFTNTLLEILNKEKPTHIAVVFDMEGPTQRHVEFEAYKAHREEMPEDLQKSIPLIMDLIKGFNIETMGISGFEADDLIGTLAIKAEKAGFTTYMMTPDKDYGQLVDANTFIYKPASFGNGASILGPEEICKKWEINNVSQLIDILGLMGDKADNIPGIPGVGEKTAIQLVKDFGTIENLLVNTDKLKGKLKERVENNKEMAIQSKWLATIILDCPVELEEEKLLVKPVNKEALSELFKELEFRAIAKKVLGEDIGGAEKLPAEKPKTAPKQDLFSDADLFSAQSETADSPEPIINFKTIKDVEHVYELVDSAEKINSLVSILKQNTEYCFDSETTSLNTIEAELVGLSFSVKEHHAYYVPISENKNEALEQLKPFLQIFEDPTKIMIGQNIKYDYQILLNYNIEIKNKLFDTMVAHFLIMPDMRHGMDILAQTYLNYSPVSISTLIGKKGKDQLSMRDVDINLIKDYAAEDADVTIQLKNHFAPLLKENEVEKLFNEVEVPLIKVLANIEREGINLDVNVLRDLSAQLQTDIAIVEKEIQDFAGTKFNVSSPKQVGEILFEYLKIVEKPKKTKTGQYATGEEVLSKLEGIHPIVSKILDYRELVKLKSTYVDTLPELVNKKTKRIHTSFNQVVAVTGRLSSDNPNLQNIPIRTERGRQIRKAFIPRDKDHVLLSADYSQIELRIVASISGDKNMCEAFQLGKDIHTATAAKVFGVAENDVTKEMRYKAKSVNFGIIYGQGAFGLSENLKISRGEAKELIDNYFKEYSAIKDYMDGEINFARENGYVKTLLGRKRWLRDITSNNATVRSFAERNAINAPIQGSAADMIKVAMINIYNDLQRQNFKTKMLLQVHDELVFDVYKPELEIVKPIIEKHMRNALPLNVPVEVGMGVGDNWLEAH
ncbi:DNA polymerase I [Sediminibacterium sp.]|uniref:DNA polymerase I n=1 Tax=Sediminibacterium sp. TaxID=1917865 RepID=UPI0027323F4E|nr:DNA polymerase I [Sediminibacterium sp.]MDP3567489.1 DNA polymerase I [Sediminibacterium sp.]